jgi:oligopeptide transport system permease protein
MLTFILRRILVAIPTILILIVISFVLMFAAPGGPFNSEKPLPEAVMRNIEARYGLDDPYLVQIFNYVKNIVLHFDFGPSFKYRDQTVSGIIAQGFPVTLTYGAGLRGGGVLGWRWGSWRRSGTTPGSTTSHRHGHRRSVLPNFVSRRCSYRLHAVAGLAAGGRLERRPVAVRGDAGGRARPPATRRHRAHHALLDARGAELRLHPHRTRQGLPMRRIVLRHALKPALLPC